jgi:type VI secretion system secreted protein VgrG
VADADVIVLPTLSVEGLELRVLRYDLREALSEVPLLSCEAMEDDAAPRAPSELIGREARFELVRTDGLQKRALAGRVVVAERAADRDGVRTLGMRIQPAPWALGRRADCRVFQKMTADAILKKVLETAGVAADKQKWQLTLDHAEREYVVQYRETDLEFLLRLCGEEGIYFAVRTEGEGEVVVFGDDPAGLGDVEGQRTLSFRHGAGFEEAVDVVYRIGQTLSVRSDKVTLRDYDPAKPKVQLEASAEREKGVAEIYDWHGRFSDDAQGKRLAEELCDSAGAKRDVVRGETGALTLAPGLRFAVDEHPYAPINRDYLVTATRIVGSTPRLGAQGEARGGGAHEYRCSFTAVPSTTRWRPPRRPRATSIVGLQTVRTTGAGGEEVHVNDAGKVKIRYPWDRLGPTDDGSSLWVPTLQLPTGGSMLLPRVGWEVMASHVEGDPDRPLVLGRLYNAVTRPPYPLPDNAVRSALQTATSPGGGSVNEIRLADGKSGEEMFLNASKDASIDVKNNTTESVGANQTRSIGSNQKKNVTNSVTASVGGSQTVSVGANQTVHVETLKVDEVGGAHSLSVGGNRDMKVGGDHKCDVGGSGSLDVGGMQVDLVVGSTTENVLGSYTHNVGAALVDLTASDRALLVGGASTETAGAVKIVAVAGGRGVTVGGPMTQQVAGAIVNVASADKAETAGATYTEVAAGAQVVKANNITVEADGVLALVMGASTVTLLPALVAVAGVSIKLDGDTADTAALVIDN